MYESLLIFFKFENSLSLSRKQSFVIGRINVVRLVPTLADLAPCQGAIFGDGHFRPRSIPDLRWLGNVEALTTYSFRLGLANIPSTIVSKIYQISTGHGASDVCCTCRPLRRHPAAN